MPKLISILLLLVVILSPLYTASSQETDNEPASDWQVTILYRKNIAEDDPSVVDAGIAVIGPNGIIRDIPFYSNFFFPGKYSRIHLSPDYRYMVMLPDQVSIYDDANEILFGFTDPYILELSEEPASGYRGMPWKENTIAYSVSSFSPDGKQIAFASSVDMEGNYLTIVDVETSQTVREFSDVPFWIQMTWTEDGITAQNHCTGCDTSPSSNLYLIDPLTGEATQTTEFAEATYNHWDYHVLNVDRLEVTGEVVRQEYSEDFPWFYQASENAPHIYPNILGYYNQDNIEEFRGQVVYRYPDYGNPSRPYWVMDGHAVLLTTSWHGQASVLLYRDGTSIIVEDRPDVFVAGVPDGWLELARYYPVQLVHKTIVGGELVETVLEIPEAEDFWLVSAPELGHSITETEFETLSPPTP